MLPFLLAFLQTIAHAPGQDPLPVTPERFVDLLDRGTAQITSYDVTIRFESQEFTFEAGGKRSLDRSGESTQRQVFQRDGNRRRIEVWGKDEGGRFRRASVTVYDGESSRSYYEVPNEGLIDIPNPFPVPAGLEYLEFFRNAAGVYDFPYVLRPRVKRGATVQRDPVVPGLLCLRVQPVIADKYARFTDRYGYAITIDPDKDFLPTRIRVTGIEEGKIEALREIRIEAFARLPEGSYVPVRVVTDFFTDDSVPPGQVDRTITAIVDEKESRWNQPLSPDLFKLGFPVGARVRDMHRRIEFISGKEDPGESVKDLIDSAVESAPMGSGKQLTPFVRVPWWKDWRWLSGIAAALLLATAVVVALRRRRAS